MQSFSEKGNTVVSKCKYSQSKTFYLRTCKCFASKCTVSQGIALPLWVNAEFLWEMQCFCERMQPFLGKCITFVSKQNVFFGETQYFCKWMQGFSEKRDTFARECKFCFPGKVSWRNALPLWANTMFVRVTQFFASECKVSQRKSILLQAKEYICKRMQSFSEKINTFVRECKSGA